MSAHTPTSRIALIAGARPNFMKIKPILDALEARGATVDLVHTGQHYDPIMSDVFFHDLGLRPPDHHLGVGSGSQAQQTGNIMVGFERLLQANPVDAVVVVGDVNSTLACALVGAKSGAVVAHVEAGLRSRDWLMPEEINRVVTDRLSDLLFAPSADAVDNLRAEGYHADQIFLAGNVMIDTLFSNVERAKKRQTCATYGVAAQSYGLVTLHRPANVDDPATLKSILGAISDISKDIPLIFPVHPRSREAIEQAGLPASVQLIDPLGYLDFLSLQFDARLVMTDSGGLQEETTALGVPCMTLRNNTERPITISEGTNHLVGTDPDRIIATARNLIQNPPPPRRPELWDGRAGDRIAEALLVSLANDIRHRPTDLRVDSSDPM